jgi:hypothetical protein
MTSKPLPAGLGPRELSKEREKKNAVWNFITSESRKMKN